MSDEDKQNLVLKWLDLYAVALAGVSMRPGWNAAAIADEARNIADAAIPVVAVRVAELCKEFAHV